MGATPRSSSRATRMNEPSRRSSGMPSVEEALLAISSGASRGKSQIRPNSAPLNLDLELEHHHART